MPQKRLLIVLDLNGTLLERCKRKPRTLGAPKHDFSVNGQRVFLRPHLDTFFELIFNLGQVATWTSAMPKNAGPLTALTFHTHKTKLMFAWARDKCTVEGEGRLEKSLKHLSTIYRHFPDFNPTNTVLIDDSPYKSIYNPDNTINIPTFSVYDETMDIHNEKSLLSLIKYFRAYQSSDYDDVREFLQEVPFSKTVDKLSESKLTSYVLAKREEPCIEVLEKWCLTQEEVIDMAGDRPPFRTKTA